MANGGNWTTEFTLHPELKYCDGQVEITFDMEEVKAAKETMKAKFGERNVAYLSRFANWEELLEQVKREIRGSGFGYDKFTTIYEGRTLTILIAASQTLARLYGLPQPNWEQYVLSKHCQMVEKNLSCLIGYEPKRSVLQIAAWLHDLGKSAAVYFEGGVEAGRSKQTKYNLEIAAAILESFAFPRAEKQYILTLIGKSELAYQFVSGETILPNEFMANLIELQEVLKQAGYETSLNELFQDLKIFWVADGAAYTLTSCLASGLVLMPSFDDQFTFVYRLGADDEYHLINIKLKKEWEEKFQFCLEILQRGNK